MKIDGALLAPDLAMVPERTRELERLGYDGVFTFEGPHEPFMPLVLAAEHSESLDLATGLAIAFARTPMTVANLAYDLHRFSKGRFRLVLGTQIQPHIERRYSMPWSRPRARIREFVLALRAIFAAWNDGERLDFRGEFYRHDLMPPMFDPGPNPYGTPPILLGGVGAAMTRTVAEVADGLLGHPLNTRRFLETVTLPAIEEGLAASGRARGDFTLACQTLIVTGEDAAAVAKNRELVRAQIAFYGSTPAYRPVLDAEGMGDLQPKLRDMTRANRWLEMGTLIPDEVLEKVASVGTPEEVADKLWAKYGDIADRVAIASPYPLDPASVQKMLVRLRALRG